MSAYNEDFRKNGYTAVLDPRDAERRQRLSDANMRQSRDKSIIGVAVLPIISKKNETVVEKPKEATEERPKRTKARRVNITLQSYHRRLAAAAVLSTTIALSGLGLSKKAVQKYEDLSIISTYSREFDKDVVRPEKHPTQDHMGYYYDYSDMAQKIMSYDNIDTAVYLLVFGIGEYQADQVMQRTPYKSMESFLQNRGYDDISDFRKKGREMLLLEDNIKKQQNELETMKNEHADYIFEPSKQTESSQNEINEMFTDPIPFDSEVDIYSGGVK